MKKVSLNTFSFFAATMILVGAFLSCSNGHAPIPESTEPPSEPVVHLSDSATVSDLPAVTTEGSASCEGSIITLTAPNGIYVLNNRGYVNGSPNESGTWKFTETGANRPKYTGSFEGNLHSDEELSTSIILKVEKVLNNDGIVTAVVEEKEFPMNLEFAGDPEDSNSHVLTSFSATIPAVKVNSVNSYIASNLFVWYRDAESYNISSVLEKIDLSDGKITYFALGSERKLAYGTSNDKDDNSIKFGSGSYSVNGKVLTGTVFNKTNTFIFNDDGNLTTGQGSDDVAFFLISGSYKIYANAVTKVDGVNSYAQQRIIYLNEDSSKTGQVMDIKEVNMTNTNRDVKDITYTISGNTLTLTGTGSSAGYSKTATITDETLTLDGVEYIRM